MAARMLLLCVLLAAVIANSHVASARHVLQAPAATMNPPVLESGPAASPAAPAATAVPPAAINSNAGSSNKKFPTLEAALAAANLTTLAAAVQAAGLAPNTTENVTILAPNNKAFERRLLKDLQMTPQQFLQNKTLVLEVGGFHMNSAGGCRWLQ
jgi:uncharacterized surface protein with fasciclin (FAS1) repeats